jgi:hypothetical protein
MNASILMTNPITIQVPTTAGADIALGLNKEVYCSQLNAYPRNKCFVALNENKGLVVDFQFKTCIVVAENVEAEYQST